MSPQGHNVLWEPELRCLQGGSVDKRRREGDGRKDC